MSDVPEGRHGASDDGSPVEISHDRHETRHAPPVTDEATRPVGAADVPDATGWNANGAERAMTPRRGKHAKPDDGQPSPWVTLTSLSAPPLPEWTPPSGFESPADTTSSDHMAAPLDPDPVPGRTTKASDAPTHSWNRTDEAVAAPRPRAWSESATSRNETVHTADLSFAPWGRAESAPQVRPAGSATGPEDNGQRSAVATSPGSAPGPEPTADRWRDVGAAIQVRELHKKFKDTIAVESVSFDVPTGSIVALLGPNGAGKTTTVNMLCTLLTPDGGSARVAGHDVVAQASDVRRSIMLTGQFAALDEALTGSENLVLFGRLLGLAKAHAKTRATELLDQFGLTAAADRRVREYSGGMRRRIDIACGLVTMPQVVFLDEPTTGLDPRSRQEVWALVSSLREQGVTTLLTTQYLEEADALSDRIVVIDRGRVIAQGTSDELKDLIGTSYCQVTPVHVQELSKLRSLVADLMDELPHPRPRLPLIDSDDTGGFTSISDSAGQEISVAVPAPDGAATLVEVVRRTSAAGIRLSDVALRRPSLDEVFLTLTDPKRQTDTSAGPGQADDA